MNLVPRFLRAQSQLHRAGSPRHGAVAPLRSLGQSVANAGIPRAGQDAHNRADLSGRDEVFQ